MLTYVVWITDVLGHLKRREREHQMKKLQKSFVDKLSLVLNHKKWIHICLFVLARGKQSGNWSGRKDASNNESGWEKWVGLEMGSRVGRFSSHVLYLIAQLPPTLCNSMDCSLPGSSVHGDSPGKNTGVGCHVLLQGFFPNQGSHPGLPQEKQILLPPEPLGTHQNYNYI